MSTNASGAQETSATDHSIESELEGPFVEPPEQGGALYWRCPDCGREILDGHEHNLTHAADCRLKSTETTTDSSELEVSA
ncbi:hypothetical protein U3A55_12000 [Salarchaeum sp. III]|uniref:hypothetical protein n=1 Tax=Salarchaeum sp. III TaxID=3107927 RepID=UPI002ED8F50B